MTADFLEKGETIFRLVCQHDGLLEQNIVLAGEPIRLRFAGQAIKQRLMPALEHLCTSGDLPGDPLTIHIWDSAPSGVQLDPPKWSREEAISLAGFNQSGLQSQYAFFNIDSGVFSYLDIEKRTAFFWAHDSSCLPVYEQGAPFLYIFHWWLANQGKRLVHAGAIGNSKGAVLLAGRSGSGKSTTSVACMAAGFSYLADDYCILSLESSPRAFSLYNTAKLTQESCHRLAAWLPEGDEQRWDHQEKQHYFLFSLAPQQVAIDLPLRAILLPSIGAATAPYLTPLNPAAALKELAPSTIFQLRGASKIGLHLMSRVVQQVPCYTLALAEDISAAPRVISNLLDTL